jgi:hypothetical protein
MGARLSCGCIQSVLLDPELVADRLIQDKTHCIASLLLKSGFVSETSIQIGLGQQTLNRNGSFSFHCLFLRSSTCFCEVYDAQTH